MSFARWTCIVIVSLLSSCTSTSSHFYTLVRESGRNRSAAVATGYKLEVEPVSIPAQVDRLELVTRRADGGIEIADGERWIAPVADELQNAFSVELLHRLGAVDSAGVTGSASVSVRLDVQRFESSPFRYALIEASWRLKLKEAGKDVGVTCRTYAYERVGGGYPEMVRGYQRAVAFIADQIATAAHESVDGVAAGCPVS